MMKTIKAKILKLKPKIDDNIEENVYMNEEESIAEKKKMMKM